ncbi:hypothetical protein VTL71DRAFT_5637 [Oculimacula yallundae]|uniref:Uncharacterized protein n=1 Tax=Oculimacula yallundae TaxID=86028 RepID=A0ABR4C1R4_9HELO
MSIYNRSKD